jgi:hypothetical protein
MNGTSVGVDMAISVGSALVIAVSTDRKSGPDRLPEKLHKKTA